MPDTIGNIEVPEVAASGTLALPLDFPFEVRRDRRIVVHTLQNEASNRKIEQRFYVGNGVRLFTLRRATLSTAEWAAVMSFWAAGKGAYTPFTFALPNDDKQTTTNITCVFDGQPITVDQSNNVEAAIAVVLREVPTGSGPTYTVADTVERFPDGTLADALLSQVQEIIPLVRIQPTEAGYPAIYVSDRRCTVGGQLYLPRLTGWNGISQSLNQSDQASFRFGNADRVMRDLADDTDLYRARIEFSLFHVGTGIKLDLWAGYVTQFSGEEQIEFTLTAADGLYQLKLLYPRRTISRTCGNTFDSVACPYTANGIEGFPDCTKDQAACVERGMASWFGGIVATPQAVRIRNTGESRNLITSTSLIDDSIYGRPLQEIYTDAEMRVPCLIAAGREEADFYAALGIIGAGPIGGFAADGAKHRLDGQANHGPGALGLRRGAGHDPVQNNDPDAGSDQFSLSAVGGGFSGIKAAGVAFLEIRRTDEKGFQPSRASDHEMTAAITGGLGGWYWSDSSTRAWAAVNTNPVWIAVNMVFRALGIEGASAAVQAAVVDVDAAIASAAICNSVVDVMFGSGTETQFKARGIIAEQKPLSDWLNEVLMNCLGYFTHRNGKLVIGTRHNSSAVAAFTEGNILADSLALAARAPAFNQLTANFADAEFEGAINAVSLYDEEHRDRYGPTAGQINLALTYTKSQAARIVTTMLREELGGITAAQWRRARRLSFATTVLALDVECGMVCSMTHRDMPGGAGEFRIRRWELAEDYSIRVEGETTVDEMYDYTVGPKPVDVAADAVPAEVAPTPGAITFTAARYVFGVLSMENVAAADANIRSIQGLRVYPVAVDELTADVWVELDDAIDDSTDPVTVSVTPNPDQETPPETLAFAEGDWVLFNDAGAYEIGQITAIAGSDWTITRAYPGVPSGQATFGSLIAAHDAGTRLYKLQVMEFAFDARSGSLLSASGAGVPGRFDMIAPNRCVAAIVAAAYTLGGFGPWTVVNLATATVPGLRTLDGGNYTFQVNGELSTISAAAPPKRVQNPSSIRVAFAQVVVAPVGSSITVLVRRSRDEGSSWATIASLTIADGEKNSFDPETAPPGPRQIPYDDIWPAAELLDGDLLTIDVTATDGEGLTVEVFT